jgi:transposase InsO family protein
MDIQAKMTQPTQSSRSSWEPTGTTGTDIKQYNINCTSGQEVLVDYSQTETTMGQMFYDRWKSKNKETIVKFTDNNKLITNLQIGGRLYPTVITLVNGMSPVVIGKDFFQLYNWQEPKDQLIETEIAPVSLRIVGSSLWIDEELTTQAIQCEEVFVAIPSVEKQIEKLHHYFGHVSAESLLKILKASSRRDEFEPKDIKKVIEDCRACKMTKRKVNRKKTALPKATGFNQVVSLDLKFHGDSTYVLWAVDEATKLIRGEVIHDKTPETMMKALDDIWITGRGLGPGMPERGFFTDNGTEFLNDKFKTLLQAHGIGLRTTSTFSPQQNGVNERNHGTADILVTRIMTSDPTLTLQQAVNKAAWAKNTIITSPQGFSPFQLVYSRNPTIPGLTHCPAGVFENLTDNEVALKILEHAINNRIIAQQIDADNRLKIAFKDRLPKSSQIPINHGDEVICTNNKTGKKVTGRVSRIDGPNAWVESGPSTHKVPLRELILNNPSRTLDSESENEDHETSSSSDESIPEIIPTRRRRLRKKSEELLVDKSDGEIEREMVRIDKRREAEAKALQSDPEDHLPRLTVWSDSEDELETNPIRPKWRRYVYFQNLWGEEFEGYVTDVMKSKPNIIWATVNGQRMVIDMNNIKRWKYKEILPTQKVIYAEDEKGHIHYEVVG